MSTSTIKTNSNNGFFLDESHNLVMLTGIDAVTQDVRAATLMRSTEDPYNQNAGVKYFEFIFTPQQSYDEARKSLAANIMASPDVTGINQLTIDISGEKFTYVAQVMTIYGPLTVRNP